MSHVSSHSPHGQSPLRTVQVLGGGKRGQQRACAVAGLGACRPGRAGHRVRPRRGRSRVRVHRRRRPARSRAAQQRSGLRGRAAGGLRGRRPRARARAARRACGPRSRSAGGAPRSSSPGTPRSYAEGARAHLLRLLERRVVQGRRRGARAPRPTSWTAPAGAGRGTPGSRPSRSRRRARPSSTGTPTGSATRRGPNSAPPTARCSWPSVPSTGTADTTPCWTPRARGARSTPCRSW